ncbi:capsular biosynthesis protein [Anaeromassilibacillus sp. An172]|uniref:DegT/DnrJ/EryC1/StrS family aminotransferase n=1 Tax=Anaeromassilibacillus sp. An172 TaxID=1965570 RepID=UPI000B37A664|nr:DegT/DnrJ/EryC1/StrS family aminotransferase [Anaeromassilibacillus sp. An172]OUP79419.1 capsular biosynthesis protein [Anaeromassilibacillus sp. An172]
MLIPFSPPDITEAEIAEVVDTLKSGWITTGPKTKQFEKEIASFCHTEKAVCLNSATACLEGVLHFLGIGAGDEVITSAYTYTASASIVCHVGAKLVLVDTAPGSCEMDYEQLAEKITEKTKAIIPVDLAGVVCDYEKIYEIVNEKKAMFRPANKVQEAMGRIAVIADASHAFGAMRKGKMCGEIADFTAFSFHAVKNLTTAEGGAVTWREIPNYSSEEIYRFFMLYSLHGQTKDALSKTKVGQWEYDILLPGYKCNMTDIMAAIGLAQLRRYPSMLERRKHIVSMYNKALENMPVRVLNHYDDDHQSSGHLYLVYMLGKSAEERNLIIEKMAEKDIATNVHYKPLPLLTAYKNLGFKIEDYPNAYDLYKCEITLPLHTKLTDEQAERVINTFAGVLKESNK